MTPVIDMITASSPPDTGYRSARSGVIQKPTSVVRTLVRSSALTA